jgi:hypothetical protein
VRPAHGPVLARLAAEPLGSRKINGKGDLMQWRGRLRTRVAVTLVLAALGLVAALAATAQAYVPGAPVWLRTQGSYLRPAGCYAVAGGPGGTIVQTGQIGNQAGTNNDILVMKTDAAGHRLFTQTLGGRQNLNDSGNAVASDRWGDVFVGGTITVSDARDDLVIIKYGPTGKRLWVRTYDGPGHTQQFNPKLQVDAQGAVYVAAISYSTASQAGIVVMKFDASGHRTWITRLDPIKNTQTNRYLSDMTRDGAGNLYLCGQFQSPPPAQTNHLIVYKVAANGHVRWGRKFSAKGGASTVGNVIAVRGDRVAVAGQVWRSDTSTDMLLVTYDLAGNQKFAFTYHSKVSGQTWVNGVVLDPGLNAYLTGSAWVAAGPGFMTLKVDPRGRLIWGRSLGRGIGGYIAQDSAGTVFVAGAAQFSSHTDDWETASFTPRGVRRWLRIWQSPGNGKVKPGGMGNPQPYGLVLSGTHALYVGGWSWGNDTVKGVFSESALIRYNR